ncbi:MAG TPA: glycosyltransferase family 4 protein [Solirubrobacteraceae bacterium]|nr:glycosyltransferase family 4 protein [Solirubrobacteraceae bacterium]
MTASPESAAGHAAPARGRRAESLREQERSLPAGAIAISCTAPLGSGGLGRHLLELRDAARRAGSEVSWISADTRTGGGPRHVLGLPYLATVLRSMPALPSSPGVRARAAMIEFDDYAAARLPANAEHLVAFNGQALAQLAAARRAGLQSAAVVSANPHMRRLQRQHALARERYPLEGSWGTRLLDRNLAEYERADRIYYASEYVRESFLAEGAPEEKLARFPLTPDPRYQPDPAGARSERFEIVYVGSLSVHKGVPLLIDAVRRLVGLDLGLRLIGGWGTPGMRRFVQRALAADARISVCPGDPLPHLRAASLCVHPAYEDGFGYAPAEAQAAGVPVIVSEDTGMKELIAVGRDGLIVPTGDLDALTEAIEQAYRGTAFPAGGDG